MPKSRESNRLHCCKVSVILVVAIGEASGSSMGSQYVCCRKLFAKDRPGRYQCPLTGNHHFYTFALALVLLFAAECQCPLTGNHHFYADEGSIADAYGGCQCPLTGNHHFYDIITLHCSWHIYRVSMPSNGQPSFLPLYEVTKRGSRFLWCQCPLTGNHHFYRVARVFRVPEQLVSMPSNGQPSFLRIFHVLCL